MRHPIIVGYDRPEPARRALARAAGFAGEDQTVIVVTAFEPLLSDSRTGAVVDPSEGEEQDRLLAQGRDLLASEGIAASTLPKEGEAEAALIEAATEADAALLVVGARGRNPVTRTPRIGEHEGRSRCAL